MTKTQVCMDNCALQTTIEASSMDGERVELKIKSDCVNIQEIGGDKRIPVRQNIPGFHHI